MKNNSFNEIKQIIDKFDNLLIISHILPDGDNIGSVLALSNSLIKYGKKVTAVTNGTLPEYYQFLPGADKMITAKDIPADARYDLLIYLDSADFNRVWNGEYQFEPNYKHSVTINIDHHISNNYYSDYNYVDAHAAATCEIIAYFIKECHLPMDSSVAMPLYTGILTDTGKFTFKSTTSNTLSIASYLLDYDVDLSLIRENVYENVSFRRKKLLGYILNNFQLSEDGTILWSFIDYDKCQELNVTGQDFEGVNEEINTISGVKIGILLRELQPNVIKVGYRSKDGYDVNYIAGQFGGGGHILASGCTIHDSLENATKRVLNATYKYMEDRA